MSNPMNPRRIDRAADAANAVMTLLVSLYAAFVVVLTRHDRMPIPVFLLLAAAVFAALTLLRRRAGRLQFALPASPGKLNARVVLGCGGFCLFVLALYLIAFFPGGFSTDTAYQWRQIHGRAGFTDWHPALHTMLLAALTALVDHPSFVIFVQFICYAASVGYAAGTLERWGLPRPVWMLFALYLSVNPAISNIMTFPWKDCAFAICALFLAAQLLNVHLSRGAWLEKRSSRLALALMLALVSLFRHNGLAMTLPVCVWLLVSLPGQAKRTLCAALAAGLMILLVRFPLYDAFQVNRNRGGLDEVFGVPITILSNIYVHAPESLDPEIVEFLEDVAPRSVYLEHHSSGDWNETKWFVGTVYFSKPYALPQVFSFALRAAAKEPGLALEALGYLWQMPMWPFCDAYWRISPYLDPSGAVYQIESSTLSRLLLRTLDFCNRLSAEPLFAWLTWNPGFWLLAVMIACALFARRRPLSALTLPAMLIAYNLATSLVLSSPTDFRFFLSTPILAPLCLIALLSSPGEG